MTNVRTHKWNRWVLMGMTIVTLAMANVTCNDTDNVTVDNAVTVTATATAVPLGDDGATDLVDGIRKSADDDGWFMRLWRATAFATPTPTQ